MGVEVDSILCSSDITLWTNKKIRVVFMYRSALKWPMPPWSSTKPSASYNWLTVCRIRLVCYNQDAFRMNSARQSTGRVLNIINHKTELERGLQPTGAFVTDRCVFSSSYSNTILWDYVSPCNIPTISIETLIWFGNAISAAFQVDFFVPEWSKQRSLLLNTEIAFPNPHIECVE